LQREKAGRNLLQAKGTVQKREKTKKGGGRKEERKKNRPFTIEKGKKGQSRPHERGGQTRAEKKKKEKKRLARRARKGKKKKRGGHELFCRISGKKSGATRGVLGGGKKGGEREFCRVRSKRKKKGEKKGVAVLGQTIVQKARKGKEKKRKKKEHDSLRARLPARKKKKAPWLFSLSGCRGGGTKSGRGRSR